MFAARNADKYLAVVVLGRHGFRELLGVGRHSLRPELLTCGGIKSYQLSVETSNEDLAVTDGDAPVRLSAADGQLIQAWHVGRCVGPFLSACCGVDGQHMIVGEDTYMVPSTTIGWLSNDVAWLPTPVYTTHAGCNCETLPVLI